MRRYAADTAAANRAYHERFAASLVAGLGYDAALDECLNNGWQGVIGVLLSRRAHSAAMHIDPLSHHWRVEPGGIS